MSLCQNSTVENLPVSYIKLNLEEWGIIRMKLNFELFNNQKYRQFWNYWVWTKKSSGKILEFIPPFLSTLKLLILTSLYISTLCSQNCTFTRKFNFSLLQGRVNDPGFSNSLQQFLFLYLYFASMPLMQHRCFSKLESFFIFFKNGHHPKWYPMYPTIIECYFIY